MSRQFIKLLRTHQPITFTVANTVTSSKVADALGALGASPIMSVEVQEARELVKVAQAVVLNLGTPTKQLKTELATVAQAANQTNTPLVLDPVACGSTAFRLQLARQLLSTHHFTIIRGNAGEIASLVGIDWHNHGIDAGIGHDDPSAIAKRCAIKYQTTVVLSGDQDIITDGQQVFKNSQSTRWLTVNVGAGDILSSVIGALLGVGADPLTAGLIACRIITTAGIRAGKGATGLGNWQAHFLDELSRISDKELAI